MEETLRLRVPLDQSNDASDTNASDRTSECLSRRYRASDADRNQQRLPKEACHRCQSVKWTSLAQLELPDSERELSLLKLETRSSLLKSACPLCRFLARIVPEDVGPRQRVLQVYAAHYRLAARTEPYGTRRRASVLGLPDNLRDRPGSLAILRADSSSDDFSPHIVRPLDIDYTVVSEWLATCRSSHECQVPRGSNLPGFKVIDCRTKSVVLAPDDCSYVALSYVWGPPSDQKVTGQAVGFPLTIEDSIAVTVQLGFHYLWVDRYCIDQEDSPEKQAQIAQMDRIYSEAEATIIAAAGKDPSYGLPGVSRRPREPQRAIDWGGITMVEVFPRTPMRLETATWTSRAWTYQESFLSRRRLIFTDRQISFVCNAMYCVESIRHNAQDYPSGLKLSDFYHLIPGARNHPPLLAAMAGLGADTMQYVKEYSKRKLSYDSDALNAILGILASVEKTTPVAHIWGVPVNLAEDQEDVALPNGKFSLTHNYIALCWYRLSPARRRKAFPSWSWVGWDGHVEDRPPGVLISHVCEMEIVDTAAGSVPIPSYVTTGLAKEHAGKPDAPCLLKITAPTLHLSFVHKIWEPSQSTISRPLRNGLHVKVSISEGLYRLVWICLDEELTEKDQLSGSLAVVLWDRRTQPNAIFLLVKQVDQRFSRIGMADEEGRVTVSSSPYVDDAGDIVQPILPEKPLWLEECRTQTIVLE